MDGLFPDEPAASAASTPYRVLARKYRPTTFDDLIGQDVLVRILRNAFALNRLAHAWLLTGVRGVGKTTTARILARALNCIGSDGAGGPTADPCGTCPNCTAILADRHPDVVEMDAASNTGVDDVREIIEGTRFRPLQARTKVFIIDEVHMLSRNAFNALLKTLEEPPPHVKFVFATTELRKVPVTVVSRCQRFDLRRVGAAELAAHFIRIADREAATIEPEAAAALARAADGSVRDGLSLLDQAIAQTRDGRVTGAAVAGMLGLGDRAVTMDVLDAVLAGDAAAMLGHTGRLHDLGADLGALLADLLDLLHTLTRLKTLPALAEGLSLPELERTRGAALAASTDIARLGRAWQMLLKGIGEVEAASDRRAAAEMVLIRLCHVADLPTPADLVRALSDAERAPDTPPARRAVAGAGGGATAPAPARAVATAPSQPAREAVSVPRPTVVPDFLTDFAAVVAFAEGRREALLASQLREHVHVVRYAPPLIELRPDTDAPRDLAARLRGFLSIATGMAWQIAVVAEAGVPTLAEAARAATEVVRREAASRPIAQAILAAFPGARIEPIAELPTPAHTDPAEPEDEP